MEQKIDALFSNWQQGLCPGGQVLVLQKGQVIFEKCYGYGNLETQSPITPDTIFHVASLTKPFTAMCIMLLQERGLLDIHEDVRKYVPDMIGFSEPLTLKQLLNMVSGLRGYYEMLFLQGRSPEDHYAQAEIRRMVARQTKLNFQPGSEFTYTNAKYVMLATIVERLSGQTLNEFATENIFKPLGMDKSFIRDDPHRIIPNKANSYHDDGYAFRNAILNFGIYGGTSLHTCCRDVVKFLDQYRQPTLIRRQTLEEVALTFPMVAGKQSNYGGGIMTELIGDYRAYHHGGVNAGFRSIGLVVPEAELTVAILSNTYNIPVVPLAKEIVKIVLDIPRKPGDWLESYAEDSCELENLDGLYRCETRDERFHVAVQAGKVYLDGDYMAPVDGNRFRHGRRDVMLAVTKNGLVTKHGAVIDKLIRLEEFPEPELLDQCPGKYYCDDVQSHYEIAAQDGRLYMDHLRHGRKQLYRIEKDHFIFDMFHVRFCRNAENQITGYLVSSPHLRNVEFRKI